MQSMHCGWECIRTIKGMMATMTCTYVHNVLLLQHVYYTTFVKFIKNTSMMPGWVIMMILHSHRHQLLLVEMLLATVDQENQGSIT